MCGSRSTEYDLNEYASTPSDRAVSGWRPPNETRATVNLAASEPMRPPPGGVTTRRQFLGSLGAAGAAVLLTPHPRMAPAARGDRLRALRHPLYRQPTADATAIPRFVQPLPVPADRGS